MLELDHIVRERAEAARPRPQIEQLRERARVDVAAEPLLNSATRSRSHQFPEHVTSARSSNFIGKASGINVTFDPQVPDSDYTVDLDGVTLEQALNQI